MEPEQHQSDIASEVDAPPSLEGEAPPPVLEHEGVTNTTSNEHFEDQPQPTSLENDELVHSNSNDVDDRSPPASPEVEEIVQPANKVDIQPQHAALEHEGLVHLTDNGAGDQDQQDSGIQRGNLLSAPADDSLDVPQLATIEQNDVALPASNDVDNQDQLHQDTERENALSASEDDSEDIILPRTSGQDEWLHAGITDADVSRLDEANLERTSFPSANMTDTEEQHPSIGVSREEAALPGDVDVVAPTLGEEEQQQSIIATNEDEVLSNVVDVDLSTDPAPKTPPRALTPFPLLLHDATIECVCPPGTTRQAKDIAFTGASKGGPRWVHVSCKLSTAGMSPEKIDELKAKVDTSSATSDLPKHMTQLLGHAPNERQRLFLKNFTSTFHCDGPCEGPKSPSDWILCKKCCAWQHKPCMLYGDRRDRGGPVCNRCYMSFLLHRDEIVAWQRKRLLEAVKEGWIYLNNPENCHQEWRRAWIRRWLARFFQHNQVIFHKYCVARHRAERLTAAQAYYSRVKVMPQVGETQQTQAGPGSIKEELGQSKRRTSVRKQPERKKAPSKAQLTEPDDDPGNGPEASDAADSDEIIVASSTKTKPKAKPKPKPIPARSTGKKATAKRRASFSFSPSPLRKKNKPTKSRAPRKSAPTFGRFVPSMSGDDDGDDEKEEQSDPEEMVVQRGGPPVPASQPTISCRCPGKAPTARDCFKCRDCGIHQHYACANDVKDGLSVVCNFCHVRSPMQSPAPPSSRRPMLQGPPHVSRPPRPNPSRPNPAPAPPQQTVQPPQQSDPALQDEVNHLCATVLWREYCTIPMPDEDEPATNPASGPAPPDWLAECQKRLMSLLTSAGQQQTTKYLVPALAAWPRQNHQIMKALRELAIEEIFYGSFRKKRKELGLVLEVLGLEEKGSVWKSQV